MPRLETPELCRVRPTSCRGDLCILTLESSSGVGTVDIPSKKLVRLLAAESPTDVRAAAAVVLGELGVKDAEANAALLALLDDPEENVRLAALVAVGKLKLAKALPTLLARIKRGGEEANLAADSAAKLGADGVKGLQSLVHSVAPGLKRYIASALVNAGATAPEAGVAVLLDKDPQIAAAAATAIVARVPQMTKEQKSAFVKLLVEAASSKKIKPPPPAEPSIVRVLAALNDPAAASVLWDRTAAPYPLEVRSAALQAVGGWLATPTKDQWRRLFAAAADAEFAIAAPALVMLNRLAVNPRQLDDWVALFAAPDIAARRLALDKVGAVDAPEVAAALMEQLHHPDRSLRETARGKLALLENGRKALAAAVSTAATADDAWNLARSVAPFAAGFPPKLRDDLFAQAGKYLEANDHRADALLFLLREADAPTYRDRIHEIAVAKRKKKDYESAVRYLKLLARDPAVGLPVRLELAMCGLKLSGKEVAADMRATDVCLRQFEQAIETDAPGTQTAVEKAKWLDAEDLFYLGFHFVERSGVEKAFGTAMLKLVVAGKTKLAAAAKNKLKSAG